MALEKFKAFMAEIPVEDYTTLQANLQNFSKILQKGPAASDETALLRYQANINMVLKKYEGDPKYKAATEEFKEYVAPLGGKIKNYVMASFIIPPANPFDKEVDAVDEVSNVMPKSIAAAPEVKSPAAPALTPAPETAPVIASVPTPTPTPVAETAPVIASAPTPTTVEAPAATQPAAPQTEAEVKAAIAKKADEEQSKAAQETQQNPQGSMMDRIFAMLGPLGEILKMVFSGMNPQMNNVDKTMVADNTIPNVDASTITTPETAPADPAVNKIPTPSVDALTPEVKAAVEKAGKTVKIDVPAEGKKLSAEELAANLSTAGISGTKEVSGNTAYVGGSAAQETSKTIS